MAGPLSPRRPAPPPAMPAASSLFCPPGRLVANPLPARKHNSGGAALDVPYNRHPGEGRDSPRHLEAADEWVPAFAGMTGEYGGFRGELMGGKMSSTGSEGRNGDMARSDIFHPDFQPLPYWWEAYAPAAGELADVPREARVAIVGGGYAGLAAALELAKQGVAAVVLERGPLGIGASTRNGGSVSGGVNIGKSFSGRAAEVAPERAQALLADAADAFSLIERLIADEKIDCFWQKNGRFVGAWTPKHYAYQERRLAGLNNDAQSGATMVPRERQRDEIASDYYYGGMVVERSASLHPALYYKGLLDACRRRGVRVCADAGVERIAADGSGWRVTTSRGTVRAGHL